jgi:hypothetical protein
LIEQQLSITSRGCHFGAAAINRPSSNNPAIIGAPYSPDAPTKIGLSMTIWLARGASVLAGFCLWAGFALVPLAGGAVIIREAWDRPLYWQIGVPLLLMAQAAIAALSREKISHLPLWTLAGHTLAMILVSALGTSFSLLPLAMIFIAPPAYGALITASWTGRRIGRLLSPA